MVTPCSLLPVWPISNWYQSESPLVIANSPKEFLPESFPSSNPNYTLTVDAPEIVQNNFQDDEKEPNDRFEDATDINNKIGQTLENLVIVENNQDWFKFELTHDAQPGDFVQIDFNGNAADLDLELHDEYGLLDISSGTSDTEQIFLEGLTAGEYAIKVFNYEYQYEDTPPPGFMPFGNPVTNYSLLVQATIPTGNNFAGDNYEPNNDRDTAHDLRTLSGDFSLQADIHEARNADWFKFQTEYNGVVNVDLDFEHYQGDLDLQIYKVDETGDRINLASSETTNDSESVSFEATAAETYYVEVYGYAGATNPEYNLHIDAPTEEVVEEDKPEEEGGVDQWTIMVYINADNNLDAAGIDDINEMEAVMNLPDNVNVVVQIDRSDYYSYGDWSETRRGLITPDSDRYEISSELESIGEQNMGEAATLTEFINWSKENYTAENYSLVIWDHGGGLDGISWDESSDYDNLSIDDVTQAISAAELGDSLGMVGFDACLMALAEVGYDLSELTDVVVASQQIEPGDGWDYTGWLEELADSNGYIDAEDLAEAVIDSYDDFYNGGYTQSAVITREYENLKQAIDNFAHTVLNNASDADWQGIVQARNAAPEHDWQLPDQRDLRGFMQSIAHNNNYIIDQSIQDAASQVINAVDETVIDQVDGLGYGGIGVYLPSSNSTVHGDYNENQLSFLTDNAWDDFIQGLANSDYRNLAYRDVTETSNNSQGMRSVNFSDSPSSPYQLGELNVDIRLENLSIDNANDVDWFEFNLPDGITAEASIGIEFSHDEDNLKLELYRQEDRDTAIEIANTEDDNESVIVLSTW